MAPFGNAEIIPLSEVPCDAYTPEPKHRRGSESAPIVLVVDDEPLVADTLAAILTLAGYAVVTAYGGLKALELVLLVRPALVITDVAMPEMSGIELAMAVVKSMPECGVVLFSGHATVHDLAVPRKAGYNFTLLSKPVHPEVILKHVSQQLRNTQHTGKLQPLSVGSSPEALTETA